MRLSQLCVIAAVVCAGVAGAQPQQPREPEIVTGGRGEVRVAPNRAILVVTVETRAPTASQAALLTAKGVASTIASLRAAGAPPDRITNGGYSVGQDFENGDRRRPRGFLARNSVRVEVPVVADVGKLIDAALAGGATLVAPIQFLGPNMENARREALRIAVEEARRDAEVLANAAGGSLGRLLSLSSGAAPPQYREIEFQASSTMVTSSSVPTTIAPSDLVVSAVASARWEFLPRR